MKFKIVFIGGLTNGKKLLEFLNNDKDSLVELIVTYPKKQKRPRYANINKKEHTKIIYDTDISSYIDLIKEIKPDFIFVCGWSYIIPELILNIAKIASIGFHPSKLPIDRGRSVLAWQIEEGYRETALSMFYLEQKIDSGDLIDQIIIKIDEHDNINDVLDKIDIETKCIIKKNYPLLKKNKIKPIVQNEKNSTYRELRTSKHSLINWNTSAKNIHNKIRAITKPYPGAEGFLGKNKYKFWKSVIPKKSISDKNYIKGYFKFEKDHIMVKCKDKFILILDYEKM